MSETLLTQVSKERLVELLLAERTEKNELSRLLTEVTSKGKKATEKSLDDLQGILSEVMTEQVKYKEQVIDFDADGNQIVTGVERYTATPALLGVIEKFLKNNNIQTDISTNENTQTLQDAMKRKKKHSDTRLPTLEKIVQMG